jgi:serine phosphatase RsbU (regulator of sigma subunit)
VHPWSADSRASDWHHQNFFALHDAVLEAVALFTGGAPQSDDITVLALEYRGEQAST